MRRITRRDFAGTIFKTSAAGAAASFASSVIAAPAVIESRPRITHGIASGDVSFDSAVVWSRTDRRARMLVEWSTTESFAKSRRVRGAWTGEDKDFTTKLLLNDLPPGQRIFYRIQFESDSGTSEPIVGQFVTAAHDEREVFFAFSGDTCGQGYGINEEFGGLKTYDSIRRARPDFFIHSGDNIYADQIIEPELRDSLTGKVVTLPDGRTWKNLTTLEKSHVAETLADYRGCYRYNLLDANVRRFNAEVPIFAQWDDHEVLDNWYPGKTLFEKPKYTVKEVNTLIPRARQAFFEYLPLRGDARSEVYRTIDRGPLCEIFMLDERSYRGPNSANRQSTRSHATDFMGSRQLDWLKNSLRRSRSVWKVIASDMPIGIPVGDGRDAEGNNLYEACANGHNGPPLGRELEIAELLSFVKRERIRNIFWLTADVHYAASLYYDPGRAQFSDFDGFWEFVSGPLHAASLSPANPDNTFGPEFRWTARKKGSKASGPYTNEQYFSTVRIDGKTKVATVTHCNRDGEKLWSIDLEPKLA